MQGGGAYGALEAGIIQAVYENKYANNKAPYDFVTGISAGGINAGWLSFWKDDFSLGLADIKEKWINLKTKDVYFWNPIDNVKLTSFYSNLPLKTFLTANINPILGQTRIPTVIGSTNLNTGLLEYFKYDQVQDVADLVDILINTSSIPVVFPANAYKDSVYVDGGEITNEIVNNLGALCPEGSFVEFDVIYSGAADMAVASFKNNADVLWRNVEVAKSTFNNQLADLVQICKLRVKQGLKVLGKLNVYSTTSNSKYGGLDFDQGEYNWNLGYTTMKLDQYDYC